MEGRIGLKSKPGEGSIFWFTVRFRPQQNLSREIDVPAGTSSHRVLIMEENPSSGFTLAAYLSHLHCRPVRVGDKKSAIHELKTALAEKDPFQFILADFKTVISNHLKLIRILKSHPEIRHIPVVLFTTCKEMEAAKRYRNWGIAGYLEKPFRLNQIKILISHVFEKGPHLLETSQPVVASEAVIPKTGKEKRRILVAEDYRTNQQVVMRHLEKAGYETELAETGRAAVARFREERYDLVLMDINMPEMDGYEATQKIRRIEEKYLEKKERKTGRVPIVALTAHAVKEVLGKCLGAGMDDTLTKPVRKKDLLAMIDKWINNRPIVKDSDPLKGLIDKAEDPPPLELDRAIEEFDGDGDFFMEVLTDFKEKVKDQIETMREGILGNRPDIVKKEAHTIKGGAANLTALPLSQMAAKLERIGATGTLDHAPGLLDRMEEANLSLYAYVKNRHDGQQNEAAK